MFEISNKRRVSVSGNNIISYKAKKNKSLCLKAAARICFSVCVWFSEIQGLNFFCLLNFFPVFLWTCLSKYTRKDMTDTMKHFEQQASSTLCSVLYLVHPKSSSIFQSCERLKSDTSAAQNKKKNFKKMH